MPSKKKPTHYQQLAINYILSSTNFFLTTFDNATLPNDMYMHTCSENYDVSLAKATISCMIKEVTKMQAKQDGDDAVKLAKEIINHPR